MNDEPRSQRFGFGCLFVLSYLVDLLQALPTCFRDTREALLKLLFGILADGFRGPVLLLVACDRAEVALHPLFNERPERRILCDQAGDQEDAVGNMPGLIAFDQLNAPQ